MKKLFLGAVMITGFASFSFAQTAKPATVPAAKPVVTKTVTAAKPAATTTTTAKPAFKTTNVTTTAKPAVTAPAKTDAAGVVLKKDGTPDKRFKNATPAAGPLKKDGTPDKRFKANKKS